MLVTGCAGFIGHAVTSRLLARGDSVVGLDNLDDTYSIALKRARLARCEHERFTFIQGDVASPADLARAFAPGVDRVVHLAARVGVRPSLVDPEAYVIANLVGFCRTLEAARQAGVKHFVFASSSSVYGANRELPFTETQRTDHPVSFYAATKKADELLAYVYSHSHRVPATALRLFTVYGPWGRPDMAVFAFAHAIARGTPLRLHGDATRRDFTYIDDAAAAIVAALDRPPVPAPEVGSAAEDDAIRNARPRNETRRPRRMTPSVGRDLLVRWISASRRAMGQGRGCDVPGHVTRRRVAAGRSRDGDRLRRRETGPHAVSGRARVPGRRIASRYRHPPREPTHDTAVHALLLRRLHHALVRARARL